MNEIRTASNLPDSMSMPLQSSAGSVSVKSRPPDRAVRFSTSSIVPYAQYAAERIGHLGIIGLSLIVFSIVSFFSANWQVRGQIRETTDLLDIETANVDNSSIQRSGNPVVNGAQQIFSQLPVSNDLPGIMGRIVSVASSSGISLDSGSYELAPTESPAVSRYVIKFPVRGSYPQVRKFIENTLAAVPAAALEGMRIERAKVSDQVISADLKFGVLVRSEE